jgi:hypothetical protein
MHRFGPQAIDWTELFPGTELGASLMANDKDCLDTNAPPFRCGTRASMNSVANLLNLPPPTEHDQDWELCIAADPDRLDEYLTVYANHASLTDDEKFTVMEIILFSFDDWVAEGRGIEPFANRVRAQLTVDFSLHAWPIHYWCCWEHELPLEDGGSFSITPFMREVWQARLMAAEPTGVGPDAFGKP